MHFRKLRVLLVEDYAPTRQILGRMLSKDGHEVYDTSTGAVAFEKAQRQQFDLLICDIGLPDTTGWDLFEKLAIHQPHIRAIALSGYAFPTDIERSIKAGFAVHLKKPAEWSTIKSAIQTLFPVHNDQSPKLA